MAFPAFLATCTLYGIYLADTVLRLADAETFRPLSSATVLDELRRNLIKRGITASTVDHRITQMQAAFPDAEVTGYQPLIGAMTCDDRDRHVLAAAVRADAEVLVTFNTRDFPDSATEPFDISVIHPDDFLLDQLDLHPEATHRVLRQQAAAYRNPPHDVTDLLQRLAAAGVHRFAAEAAIP